MLYDNKQLKTNNWIFILIILGAVIVGGIVYAVLNDSNSGKQTLQSTSDNTVDWKTYENSEIGLRFAYPARYGDFQVTMYPGETGQKYVGTFPGNKYFSIGVITADYTAPRSGNFLDFVQYLSENGKYYHLLALDKRALIEPTKVLSTVDNSKVLIVNENSYVDERGLRTVDVPSMVNPGTNGGALINISDSGEFRGVAVWNANIEELPQSNFEDIVRTFQSTR